MELEELKKILVENGIDVPDTINDITDLRDYVDEELRKLTPLINKQRVLRAVRDLIDVSMTPTP